MRKLPLLYVVFFAAFFTWWLYYMIAYDYFSVYLVYWKSAVTMFFGSFVAGATSEGGGAVAFPVFTLVLKLAPSVARNFSFMCQSIGMTAASLMIIGMKIKIDKKAIKMATIGGIPGLVFGAYFVTPFISPPLTKIFFVSLWLSFSFALFIVNRKSNRIISNGLQHLLKSDVMRITIFGFIGGIITAIFGDGVNIFTFCLFVLYYNTNEKIATPTSVIIMTIHTIFGTLLHALVLKDITLETFNYWICAAPVALIMAPLGAYVINFLSRERILNFFYIVSVIQYFGALVVLRPSLPKILMSAAILVLGYFLFRYLNRKGLEKSLRPAQLAQEEDYLANVVPGGVRRLYRESLLQEEK